jgi:putative peptide zinc metalloprotease protein
VLVWKKVAVAVLALGMTALLVVGVQALTGDPAGSPDEAAAASPSPEGGPPTSQVGAVGDNIVVLVNQHDGKFESKAKDEIEFETGDAVNNRNVAAAYSQCSACRTVAVAIQVVLAMGPSSDVSPENMALAINQDCTSCVTMAWAYQYVATTGGDVKLADGVKAQFHATGAEVAGLIDQPMAFDELDARLDGLIHEMWDSIAVELKKTGKPEGKAKKDTDIDANGGSTASPTPSPSAPEPSTTAEPSQTPSTEPSTSPSPTESAAAPFAVPIAAATLGRRRAVRARHE